MFTSRTFQVPLLSQPFWWSDSQSCNSAVCVIVAETRELSRAAAKLWRFTKILQCHSSDVIVIALVLCVRLVEWENSERRWRRLTWSYWGVLIDDRYIRARSERSCCVWVLYRAIDQGLCRECQEIIHSQDLFLVKSSLSGWVQACILSLYILGWCGDACNSVCDIFGIIWFKYVMRIIRSIGVIQWRSFMSGRWM
jgi:hypothetical protein